MLPTCFLSPLAFPHLSSPSKSNALSTSPLRPKMSFNTPFDLLIVGAGKLGHRIGTHWHQRHPSAQIYGETRTETSHPRLRSAGIIPVTPPSSPSHLFPYVVFCVPASAFDDYPAAVAAALARVKEGGRMVFTSSGSVHGREATLVTERTPVGSGERAKLLGEAERAALGRKEGRVVRLTGLYTLEVGGHAYWINNGRVSGPVDGMLNFLYYGDAAMAVVKVLEGGKEVETREKEEGRIYLASVERSLTKREICKAALRHPFYQKKPVPQFGDEKGTMTRIYDNRWTREVLGWKPQFEGFDEFMEEDARRTKELETVQ